MIDKTAIIKTVLTRLSNLQIGHYVDLRSYKRDRSVLIVKRGDDEFLLIEKGFYRERFEGGLAKIRSVMKTILKKEFPRSNKIRLYNMGEYLPGQAENFTRKKI